MLFSDKQNTGHKNKFHAKLYKNFIINKWMYTVLSSTCQIKNDNSLNVFSFVGTTLNLRFHTYKFLIILRVTQECETYLENKHSGF